jgi:hypothetical protein
MTRPTSETEMTYTASFLLVPSLSAVLRAVRGKATRPRPTASTPEGEIATPAGQRRYSDVTNGGPGVSGSLRGGRARWQYRHLECVRATGRGCVRTALSSSTG